MEEGDEEEEEDDRDGSSFSLFSFDITEPDLLDFILGLL